MSTMYNKFSYIHSKQVHSNMHSVARARVISRYAKLAHKNARKLCLLSVPSLPTKPTATSAG